MKKNFCLVTIAIVFVTLSSCKKENNVATTTPSPSQPLSTIMAATPASYDYSQSIDKIIIDAGLTKVATPFTVLVRPGKYLMDWGSITICDPRGSVCEIFVIDRQQNQVNSAGNKTIIDGSTNHPIGVIQAFPKGPSYRKASNVSYTENENNTEIHHTFL